MGDLVPYELAPGTVRLPDDCIKYGHFRSTRGERCVVLFRNFTDRALRVVWVDFNGRPVLYCALDPGDFYRQSTYETHPWVLEDFSGGVFATYVGPDATVTIRGRNMVVVSPLPEAPAADVKFDVASLFVNIPQPTSTKKSTSWLQRLWHWGGRLHPNDEAQCASICSICHEQLSQDLWAVRCGHVFHGTCLKAMCSRCQQPECPFCRTAITTKDDVTKLFLG